MSGAGKGAMDVDISLRPASGSHADTRLCSNARGGDGGIREKLVAGASFPQCRHASGGLGEAIPWTLLRPFLTIGAPFQ